ncbi:MAG TPA: M23 family metallopeptidase [Myxococcota bacterium]|nr:M23 family metallopeptidase [Myxococcota bacterium]
MWWWLVAACAPEAVVPADHLQFAFPLPDPSRISSLVGVDHDPEVHEERLERIQCADYLGRAFPHCYDEHDGSDFILDGGFPAMDAGSMEILAAADGVVVRVEDGHYDRCHATLDGTDCDGHDGVANSVTLEHEGGLRTLYWHMKDGSPAVAVGDEVARGDVLGVIGSSGNSSFPHLHFEVQTADELVIDPYAGPRSQPGTWWCDQGPEDGLPGPCP